MVVLAKVKLDSAEEVQGMVEGGKTANVGGAVWRRVVPLQWIYILNVVFGGAVKRLKVELVGEEDCEAGGKRPG